MFSASKGLARQMEDLNAFIPNKKAERIFRTAEQTLWRMDDGVY